jgi:hypothetical protein
MDGPLLGISRQRFAFCRQRVVIFQKWILVGGLRDHHCGCICGLGQNMKQLLLGAALAIVATAAQAQYYGTGSNPNSHIVFGYTRSNGTYVAPYVATNPNGTQRDNYSARGNANPYTGAVGTRTPRY